MLHIDLRSAAEDSERDNFTSQLMRLMMKADSINMSKLSRVYPVEGKMVQIYRENCPTTSDGRPDYEAIEVEARKRVSMSLN